MAHYLVTGGCGFIGSHLVRLLLENKHHVTVLDNLSTGKKSSLPPEATFIEGDILDQPLVAQLMDQAPDGCFHLAAIASVERCTKEWQSTSQINVSGTISVFDAAHKAKQGPVKIVYASSAAVYGSASTTAVDETMQIEPISTYGVDKWADEQYARIAWRNFKIPNAGLRFFNVYGPNQPKDSPYSGVITHFIRALEQKKPLTIFGDGQQSRDFIYVGDVACAMMEVMQAPLQTAEVFNVCTGISTSIQSLADTLRSLLKSSDAIHYMPARVGDIIFSLGNPEKLYKATGFKAETDLDTGLQATLA